METPHGLLEPSLSQTINQPLQWQRRTWWASDHATTTQYMTGVSSFQYIIRHRQKSILDCLRTVHHTWHTTVGLYHHLRDWCAAARKGKCASLASVSVGRCKVLARTWEQEEAASGTCQSVLPAHSLILSPTDFVIQHQKHIT